MKRRRNITEEHLTREASRALMRLSRYREKHGLSGPMADIVTSARICGWPEPDAKQIARQMLAGWRHSDGRAGDVRRQRAETPMTSPLVPISIRQLLYRTDKVTPVWLCLPPTEIASGVALDGQSVHDNVHDVWF
jgi:hypothetical protein